MEPRRAARESPRGAHGPRGGALRGRRGDGGGAPDGRAAPPGAARPAHRGGALGAAGAEGADRRGLAPRGRQRGGTRARPPSPPRPARPAARRRTRSEPAARARAGHGDPPALGRRDPSARLPHRRGRASLRRRRLRPARAGDRLDPPARPAGGRRADLAALPRRRRGRRRQRRQLGAVAPRGIHLHQPGPHHLPPPDAGRRVGLSRGRDLAVARRHRLLREPPVGRAGPHRAGAAEPAPRPSIDVNLWAVIILAALLLDFAVERLADALDLDRLGRPLPPELRELYDADRYRRAQRYTRARTRFGILVATVDLAALLVFWFARGFDRLDQRVRGLGFG